MKKIIVIVLSFLWIAHVKAQHPVGTDSLSLQTLGNSNTLVKSKGVIGADSGIVIAAYADTTSANLGKLKNYPGALIRVGVDLWMRNTDATAWVRLTAQQLATLTFNYGFIPSDNPYNPLGVDMSLTADTTYPDGLATKHDLSTLTASGGIDFIVKYHSNSPVGGDAVGEKYLIGTSPTGDFASHANNIGEKIGSSTYGNFTTPTAGQQLIVNNRNTGTYETWEYNGGAWVLTTIVALVDLNTLGTDMPIGTTDSNDVIIRTNGIDAFTVGADKKLYAKRFIGVNSHNLLKVVDPTTGEIDTVGAKPLGEGTNITFTDTDDTLFINSTASGGGGTTTNALTMDASGAGDVPGSTFDGSAAKTISTNTIGAVPTSRTVNGTALSSNVTLTLASSQFANQGTTTTVLHGNASGNPSWGQIVNADITNSTIDLTTKVTNRLPYGNIVAPTTTSLLLGRGTSSGDWQEITLGTNLSMSGTTLNATGGGGTAIDTVRTISALENYNGTGRYIFVTDSTRGGFFGYSSASYTADSVLYFPANGKGGGYWSRYVMDGNIWVNWAGATGDSTQDATPYIQQCTNSVIANRYKTINFKDGFYWLSSALVTTGGNNAQIVIPAIAAGDKRSSFITYRGTSKPQMLTASLYADSSYPRTGVVIKSTITGSGTMPAIFGGNGGGGNTFTYHMVSFENMRILTKANAGGSGPTMNIIDGRYFSSVNTDWVIAGIDTSFFKDTIPQNEVAGIITPLVSGEEVSTLRNTAVYGMRYGIAAGEHTYLDNVFVNGNYAGILILPGSHPVYGSKVTPHWNKFDVMFNHSTHLGISAGTGVIEFSQLSIETFNVSTRWFNNVASIVDSLNTSTGHILGYNHFPNSVNLVGNFVWNNNSSIKAFPDSADFAQRNALNTFDLRTTNNIQTINSVNSYQAALKFTKNSVAKYAWLTDFNVNGTGNFALWNYTRNNATLFVDSIGNIALGDNAATLGSGAPLYIPRSTLDVTVNNKLGIGTAPSYPLDILTTSAATTTIHVRNSNASQSTTMYFDNDRNSFASYGGINYGNSSNSSSFFGLTRADKLFLIADGANNLGMGIGTLSNQPVIIGTNNAEVARFDGSGFLNMKSGKSMATATLDFGSTAAQSSADLTITVTGASVGDGVILGPANASVLSNSCFTAWVSATNTVTVRFNNYSSGAQDPASGTFKVVVIK